MKYKIGDLVVHNAETGGRMLITDYSDGSYTGLDISTSESVSSGELWVPEEAIEYVDKTIDKNAFMDKFKLAWEKEFDINEKDIMYSPGDMVFVDNGSNAIPKRRVYLVVEYLEKSPQGWPIYKCRTFWGNDDILLSQGVINRNMSLYLSGYR